MVKFPKSGKVPQRGCPTLRITFASQAALDDSPPWFSTTTSMPSGSAFSVSLRSPSATRLACSSGVPSA